MERIPVKPKIEYYVMEEVPSDRYLRVEITQLRRGFGVTIGNSIRRVLLSYIKAAAPVYFEMRINGAIVQHEYQGLEGIYEDVLEIAQNIKQIKIVFPENHSETRLRLSVNKKGEYKAKDFETDALVKIINPDQHILTLVKDMEVEIDILFKWGIGYVDAHENMERMQGEFTEGTVIFVDSLHNPVEKVNFDVEDEAGETGLEEYDRLILEIWTDGRVTPEEALKESIAWLNDYYSMLSIAVDSGVEVKAPIAEVASLVAEEEVKEAEVASEENSMLSMKIEDISDFTPKVVNPLKKNGINTVGDLVKYSKSELKSLKGVGPTTIRIVEEFLAKYNLSLKEDK